MDKRENTMFDWLATNCQLIEYSRQFSFKIPEFCFILAEKFGPRALDSSKLANDQLEPVKSAVIREIFSNLFHRSRHKIPDLGFNVLKATRIVHQVQYILLRYAP